MNSYSRELLQRVSRIKQDILAYPAKWKDATRPKSGCPKYHVEGVIQLDVAQCCTKLLSHVSPQSTEIPLALNNITVYAEYLRKLTQGKYNPAPLLAVIDVKYYDVCSPMVSELIEALSKAADMAAIVLYFAELNGKTYRGHRVTDVIPQEFITDFNNDGGMEMVETLYDGFSVEDIIGGFN